MTVETTSEDLKFDAAGRPATGRPVVYATNGVISSGHYLTSMAGMRMLLTGGNAFDAVVAAGFAAAVIEPIASYSLAAEGVFMLYHPASGDLLSLCGQGVAPTGATPELFKSRGLDNIPTGPGPLAPLAFTVPGVVDAYVSLLERYGTMTLASALGPAIEYAEGGIPHYEYMVAALDNDATRKQFAQFPPGGTGIFYDGGALPRPGSLLVQPGLASTMKELAAAESAAAGDREQGLQAARDVFYTGPIGQAIVEHAQRVGGMLDMGDLAGFRARFEEPVRTSFAGHEVCGQGPWSQAPILAQTLNILELFDLRSMGHNTPAYIHTVAEALKLALADRQAYYGDPDFAAVPIDGLLSNDYAAARAKLIDPARAHPELPAQGDPWKYSSMAAPNSSVTTPAGGSGEGVQGRQEGTTHIAVLDREGNMVCATPSGGSFGKSVFFPDLGFALSTRTEMFNLEDGHPNVLVPGKRPRTTLVSYLVLKDGVPLMTTGCPGGDHQVQGNLQLLLNTLVFGMDLQQAIEAPRFATDSAPDSFYPHDVYPGQLTVEPGIPAVTFDALRDLGHKRVRGSVCGMGATLARRDPETGVLSTGADPRRACYAIGW